MEEELENINLLNEQQSYKERLFNAYLRLCPHLQPLSTSLVQYYRTRSTEHIWLRYFALSPKSTALATGLKIHLERHIPFNLKGI